MYSNLIVDLLRAVIPVRKKQAIVRSANSRPTPVSHSFDGTDAS